MNSEAEITRLAKENESDEVWLENLKKLLYAYRNGFIKELSK